MLACDNLVRRFAAFVQYGRQIAKGVPRMSDKPKLKAKDAPDLGRFDWQDPFRMEDQLTEEERMLRDGAGLCAGKAAAAGHCGLSRRVHRSGDLP